MSNMFSLLPCDNDTLSEDKFKQFAAVMPTTEEQRHNYCPECNIPMESKNCEYQCGKCGAIGDPIETLIESSATCTIKVHSGGRTKLFTVTNDYSRVQRKLILDKLIHNNNDYAGNKFSRDILQKITTKYNNIQKMGQKDTNENGEVTCKKFVRRSNVKDEILAALIYYECISAGCARKKKDIALMMKLPTNGFSTGENILRKLHRDGDIDIPIDSEPVEDYIDRYLEALNIEDESYKRFVLDIVNQSEVRKIGMNIQLSSKIAGALWMLIRVRGLKITSAELEKAADNIRKSTFMKFYKVVIEYRRVFEPIFTKYGVPFISK